MKGNETAEFRGAHAPSRARFGAIAETLGKVREGGGAFASTRGACAPRNKIR